MHTETSLWHESWLQWRGNCVKMMEAKDVFSNTHKPPPPPPRLLCSLSCSCIICHWPLHPFLQLRLWCTAASLVSENLARRSLRCTSGRRSYLGKMAHTNTAVTLPQTQLETKQLVSWRFTAVYSHSRHLGFSSWGGRGPPYETLQMRHSVW